MKREYQLKLVRLPRIPGNTTDFYGIGYYAENGEFIFSLLSKKLFDNSPLRTLYDNKWYNEYANENEITFIDDIEELP